MAYTAQISLDLSTYRAQCRRICISLSTAVLEFAFLVCLPKSITLDIVLNIAWQYFLQIFIFSIHAHASKVNIFSRLHNILQYMRYAPSIGILVIDIELVLICHCNKSHGNNYFLWAYKKRFSRKMSRYRIAMQENMQIELS